MAGIGTLGVQETTARFDRHRFDNYTAWLDSEDRKKAKQDGRPLGYGFADPRPPPPAKEERPFFVTEPAFTSGLLVHRKYNQIDVCGYKTENLRADPYHYPNHMEVTEGQHYMDMRRRSQNVDPREWKPDPKMANVVTDEMVRLRLAAHLGESRAYYDPKLMAPLFDENVRPSAATVRELNVDLSCVDLPPREGGSSASRALAGRAAVGTSPIAHATPKPKPKVPFDRKLDPAELELARSQSLPRMTGGPSMLHGNLGGSTSTAFHGVNTRKFGTANVDPRMRGGKMARDGWAGTFPQRDPRV